MGYLQRREMLEDSLKLRVLDARRIDGLRVGLSVSRVTIRKPLRPLSPNEFLNSDFVGSLIDVWLKYLSASVRVMPPSPGCARPFKAPCNT